MKMVLLNGLTFHMETIKFLKRKHRHIQKKMVQKLHQLLKDPIDVKISENNQTVKLTIENNKSGWILPVTGGIGTTLLL